jgi:N-acyl homoserine lactone hydrolase
MAMHTLYLLHLGRLGGDPSLLDPVPGYVIRTASGRIILVDTGHPTALIGAATSDPWEPLECDIRPEDDVIARLAELNLDPADIDLLISTHFDFDHCGRHDAFAAIGIESVVQRRHLAAAPTLPLIDPALWNLPGLRYTLLDGDTELEPGLRLLETSGHVPGHQSVYVETETGPVILTIDAINREEEVTGDIIAEWYTDPGEGRRSRERLLALAAETEAFLLFGHDPVQWETLPKSPSPFRRPDRPDIAPL